METSQKAKLRQQNGHLINLLITEDRRQMERKRHKFSAHWKERNLRKRNVLLDLFGRQFPYSCVFSANFCEVGFHQRKL